MDRIKGERWEGERKKNWCPSYVCGTVPRSCCDLWTWSCRDIFVFCIYRVEKREKRDFLVMPWQCLMEKWVGFLYTFFCPVIQWCIVWWSRSWLAFPFFSTRWNLIEYLQVNIYEREKKMFKSSSIHLLWWLRMKGKKGDRQSSLQRKAASWEKKRA